MIKISKRRRHEGKTNYTKRRRMLEGKKPRIVIRKTGRYIMIQYIESRIAQDFVKFSTDSKKLLDFGWPKQKEGSLKSLPAAYLTGMLFAKIAEGKKLDGKEAIIDMGLVKSTKGSRIYSAAKGMIDAGFKTPCSEQVFPAENRIKNENSKEFFDKVKQSIEKGGSKK